MATGQILGYDSKTFWRTSRLLIQALLCALALAVVLSVLNFATYWTTSVSLLLLVALWIACYYVLGWFRTHMH